jgi:hypothetical protein
MKVALVGGAVVAVATVAGVVATRAAAAKRVEGEVDAAVRRAQGLVERGQRLHALELLTLAESLAADAEFGALFGPGTSEPDRARAAFVAIEGHNARLEQRGHKADLMIALSADGKVLSRDLDPRGLFGEDLKARFPSVAGALLGQAVGDVWLFEGKMMRVAAAPIRGQGRVVGAVVVGYVVTARDARLDSELLGTDVAYFLDGRIHASSLAVPDSVGEGGEAAEDAEKVAAVGKALLGPGGPADQALAAGRPSDILPMPMRLDGRRPEVYLGSVAPLDPTSRTRAGSIVLASLTEPTRVAQRTGRGVLAVGLVALLALFTALMFLGRSVERSLDRVEVGLAEVISGNVDYTFEAFDEFEGLCNGLNVMLARLLGRPEPGATSGEDVEAPVPPEEPDRSGEPTARGPTG